MAEIGYHPATPGASAHSNDLLVAFLRVQASENGDLTSMSIWIADNSVNYTLGIYADSAGVPGARVGVCVGATSAGSPTYQTQNFSGSPTITSGSFYWLCGQGATSGPGIRFGYDASTNTSYFVAGSAGTYSHGTLADPFGSGTSFNDLKYAVYATYTPSGGGGKGILGYKRPWRFFKQMR